MVEERVDEGDLAEENVFCVGRNIVYQWGTILYSIVRDYFADHVACIFEQRFAQFFLKKVRERERPLQRFVFCFRSALSHILSLFALKKTAQ